MPKTHTAKKGSKNNNIKLAWDLRFIYKGPTDPQIEADMKVIEKAAQAFAQKYDTETKAYLSDPKALLAALTDFEKLQEDTDARPYYYFCWLKDTDGKNAIASAQLPLMSERLAKVSNSITFFKLNIGTISKDLQKQLLADPSLARYRVLLERIFTKAVHRRSLAEEKILNLKDDVSHSMWVTGNEKFLYSQTIDWKGKKLSYPEASAKSLQSLNSKEREQLGVKVNDVRKRVAAFSEAEMNAVVTNKKIDDELRGFKKPYDSTVLSYNNDPKVIELLVKTVTDSFGIAHRFSKVKAKLLKKKKLVYTDRAVSVGSISKKFTFEQSFEQLKQIFGSIDAKYATILDSYAHNGQIDVYPKVGKKGGAYCWGSYTSPTVVLLNHTDTFDSFRTFAHEMGHAFHTELSKPRGPIYSHYSMSLAECASILFETIATDAVMESLSKKEQIIFLHDKIQSSISTIFRQIACFNYEKEIHETIRAKGYMSKEELAQAHNKHMKAYLGPTYSLTEDDGYMFVEWSHLRRFFYVYSYAYGMLTSAALLRRYRKDNHFWASIEQFLSAGGSESPEKIMKNIGIDVSSPAFFKEGIDAILEDIIKLEKML